MLIIIASSKRWSNIILLNCPSMNTRRLVCVCRIHTTMAHTTMAHYTTIWHTLPWHTLPWHTTLPYGTHYHGTHYHGTLHYHMAHTTMARTSLVCAILFEKLEGCGDRPILVLSQWNAISCEALCPQLIMRGCRSSLSSLFFLTS